VCVIEIGYKMIFIIFGRSDELVYQQKN